MSDLDMDAVMDNLEKGKDVDPDDAKAKRERKARTLKSDEELHEEYREDANYKVDCPECSYTAYRKALKGSVREAWEAGTIKCAECGHEDVTLSEV